MKKTLESLKPRDFCVGEKTIFTHNGRKYTVALEPDDCHGAPWEEEDGHGPVTDWETRDKRPGEMLLNEDGRAKRFYDFAAACRLARRDGWGFLPGDLETEQLPDGQWRARVATQWRKPAMFETVAPDVNEAIRGVYAAHRDTFPSARAYAAAAAMADYRRLKAWCDDEWGYVGVVVTNSETGETESLWGIESDAGEYLAEVTAELVEQFA